VLLFEGNSLINGEPIVAIATGLQWPSTNRKTGPMVQTWILHRDELPTEAIKSGRDKAICGDCPARGQWCYVQVGQAPNRIWQTFQVSKYQPFDLQAFRGKALRIGSYGDPAAVPTRVWADLAGVTSFWTGYTHAWRTCDPQLKKYVMASVDSLEEYYSAKRLGWRCFRVTESLSHRVTGEARCPYPDAGLQCIQCRHCDGLGTGRKGDVVTQVHGSGAAQFKEKILSS
jgi:hypothetical protein